MSQHRTDISPTTRSFFYLCAMFVLGFLAWASYSPLDIVSEAIGEIIPSTKVKRIQHLEGGIVSEIKVSEGDRVAKGQALVTLETTVSGSTVEELTIRIQSLQADIARLIAEAAWFSDGPDGTVVFNSEAPTPAYPSELANDVPMLVQQSTSLYETRYSRLKNDINTQLEKIKQREQDIQEISARIRNLKKNLVYAQEQVSISEELLKDKLTTRYKHLGFLKEVTQLSSRVEEDNAALSRSKSMLTAAYEVMRQIMNKHLEDVEKTLNKSRQDLLEYEQRLKKHDDSLRRTIIRSPVDGVVKSLYLVNVGEVVRPGITIMDVVPAGDRLVVEAHLPIGDVGYVQSGQKTIVKLMSNDARRYGNLDGIVKSISPDAITLPEQGTFYKVIVETEKDYFENGKNHYQLYPGMRVQVGILTGQRTVLEYLLYPYFDELYEGLRER